MWKWDQAALERLVVVWETAPTASEACARLGEMYSSVLGQVSRLRKLGVPLRRYVPAWKCVRQPTPPLDLDKLRALAMASKQVAHRHWDKPVVAATQQGCPHCGGPVSDKDATGGP